MVTVNVYMSERRNRKCLRGPLVVCCSKILTPPIPIPMLMIGYKTKLSFQLQCSDPDIFSLCFRSYFLINKRPELMR